MVKNEDNPSISMPIIEGLENLKVADLMTPTTLTWDYELFEELFYDHDVAEISRIPLTSHGAVDNRIWNYGKNYLYSVK